MDERHVGQRVSDQSEGSDGQLLDRARKGDDRAFHVLVDRHAPGLFELAAMMIGNTTDAQDIVQETLLGAYQHMHRFEGRSAVRTWLVGILVKQAALHRRKHARHQMPSLDVHMAHGGDVAGGAAGSGAADARLDLSDMLASLSEEHREVLVLRELEGLSYDEMAAALDLPRGTVESRLFRARQALREKFDPGQRGKP